MPQTPVQPLLHRAGPRWLRAMGAALAALLLITCSSDNPVGPGRRGIGSVRVAPAFNAYARVAPLTLDNVRVIIVRPPAETLAVVPKAFNANSNQLQINIPVFLQSVTEDLLVTLELYSGTTLLFSGTRTVRVSQGSATPPDSVPVTYQGPGSQVASLVITPRDTTINFGAVLPYTVNAADAQAQPVAQYYVSWSTIGAPTGTSIDATGRLTAPSVRDTFFVKVVTPNGIVDSTSVIIAATPSALVKVGGDGQSGLVGSRLAQPLAVQVNGSDGLPVPGVQVTFAPGVGGGTVDSATATTDPQGVARSGAVLGNTVGAQTFLASAAGLPAVTFNATGASGSGVATWTGTVSNDWNTTGNWNPALVPLATNDVIVPGTAPNQPALFSAVTVHNLTVLAGATLDLGDNDLTVTGNLDASGAVNGCCSELVTLTGGTARGNLDHVQIKVPAGAVVSLSGTMALTTNAAVSIDGELILNGHTLDAGLVNGTVTTNVQTGLVTMTNSADLLIARDATFNGGDETGHLTAGIVRTENLVGGGSVTTSFFASGTHRVELGGPLSSSIGLAVPASARFQNLDVSGVTGTMILLSDITVAGQLISHPAGGPPILGQAVGPKVITAAGVDIGALGIDQHVVVIGAGPITQFDNVAFTGQAQTATALTVNNAGTAAAFTFTGLSFAVTPTTGFYLAANDLDGATPNPLTINMVGATPAAPSPSLFSASNGAVINWPSASPVRTWVGGTSNSWQTAANWSPALVPTSANDVVIPSGTPNAPTLFANAAAKTVALSAGANLDLSSDTLDVSGNVLADGSILGAGAVRISAAGQLRGNLSGVVAAAQVTVVGGTTLSGQLTLTGAGTTFTLNGNTVTVGGTFGSTAGALLVMTNPADNLTIAGSASFDGGNELGSLSAGVLQLGTNLAQLNTTSNDAYHTSGTHLTVFTSANPVLNFATPGNVPGSSHFERFRWTGTGVMTLASDVFAHGTFDGSPAIIGTLQSAGRALQVANFVSGGVTMNNTRLVIDGSAGGPFALSNVTFSGLPTTVTQLTVNHPGVGSPFSFNNLTFSVVPTTGFYLSATDLNPSDGIPLTIDVAASTPASGAPFVQSVNGAVVNWPSAAPVKTWAGTVSNAWDVPGNWSPASVPGASDDVTIPAGRPNDPSVPVGVAAQANNLTVNAALNVSGSLSVQANLTVAGSGVMFGPVSLDGTGKTLQTGGSGGVGALTVNGTYALTGRVIATGVTITGDLALSGHTLADGGALSTTGSGTLTMTNPLDSVLVSSAATFTGGNENGRLTAGYLKIGGSIGQGSGTSPESFAASGTHRTEMGAGAVRVINFATSGPGAGFSHFNDLIISGAAGGINLSLNTYVNGQLISHPTGATPVIGVTAGPKVLTVGGVDVSGLGIDQNVMTIGQGLITQFDNVAFTGQANGVTQLTINNPGTATPLTFNGVSFAVTPTTGLYLHANDTDGASPDALTINMNAATPSAPSPTLFSATNGAVLNWPGSTPPSTWTGAVNTDWSNAGNWSTGVVPTSTNDVVIPAGTPGNPAITSTCAAKSIVVNSGGAIHLGTLNCQVQGSVTSSGIIDGTSGAIVIQGTGQISGNFPNLVISAPVTVAGATGLGSGNGNVTITGVGASLTMNGQTLVMPGNLAVVGAGVLIMNNPADVLTVQSGASFDGGNESGLLTDGVLTVFGNFTQSATSSGSSFFASGSHRTVIGGANRTIGFATPGTSRFQELDVSGVSGTLTLNSNVTVAGQLTSIESSVDGPVVTGTGVTLTAGGADIGAVGSLTAITMDKVPLVLSGGTITGFSNVTFQNQNPLGIHLTVNNVGTPSAFIFGNLNFTTGLSAGGFYIQANDLDGATPDPLTIDVAGSNPASGAGVSQANNGAIINWPPSGAAITWTGSTSSDWSDPTNWSLGRVPSAFDNATVGIGTPNLPKLSRSSAINDLTIQAGATVDLDTTIIVIGGNLDNSGGINGVVGTAGVTLTGTGKTVRGTINLDVVIPGSYSLTGDVTNVSLSMAGATGVLTLNGHHVTTTAGFSTLNNGTVVMNNPADLLVVGGQALFAGGDETGKLTAGVTQFAGDFSQVAFSSTTSFAPSGTHRTVFSSATSQLVDFGSPGAGAGGSHFQIVDFTGATGGASLTVNTIVDSLFIANSRSAKIVGGGSSITTRQVQVTALILDDTPLIIDEQGTVLPQQLDTVTFQNNTTSTLVDLTAVGTSLSARTIKFNRWTGLLGLGGTNLWAKLRSSNGIGLTEIVSGSDDPTSGPSRSDPAFGQPGPNGEVITWQ